MMTAEELLGYADGGASAPSSEPRTVSSDEIQQLHQAYMEEQQGYGDMVQKGIASNIAGVVSLVPDALREAYYLAKTEDMPDLGWGEGNKSLYDYMTTEMTNARIDPNTTTEGEKAAYYGAQGLPLFGAASMYRSGLGKAAAARQTAADVGTAYVAGRMGEENPVLGLITGAAGAVASAKTSPYRTTTDTMGTPEQRSKAAELGGQLQKDFDITETKGMSMWRAAEQMPEGIERDRMRAQAVQRLLTEQAGRQNYDTQGTSLNAAQWMHEDMNRLEQVETAIRKIAGLENSKSSDIDITKNRDLVYKMYDTWKTGEMNRFRAANAADFAKVDKSVRFSSEPTARVLMDALSDPELSTENKAQLRRELEKFARFDGEKGEWKFRTVNAEDIKDSLSRYGKLAYGKGDEFKYLPPGKQRFYGSQLLTAMNETLDSAGDVGDALRQARTNYSQRLTALQKNGERPLIKLFDEVGELDPKDMANAILQNSGDATQMSILKTALTAKDKNGNLLHPELYDQVREQAFRQLFTSTQIGAGRLDLNQIVANIGTLQDNAFFFGERGRIASSKQLFKDLEGVLANSALAGLDKTDQAYLRGKMGAEALGSLAGAKGRYVGELAVKTMLFQRLKVLKPEAAAKMANDPASTYQLIKYLKGDSNLPNTAQLQAAKNLGLIEWVQKAGVANSILQRQEEDTTKAEKVKGLFD